MRRSTEIKVVVEAARQTAEKLEGFAYSDRTQHEVCVAALQAAGGWRVFADEVRALTADAAEAPGADTFSEREHIMRTALLVIMERAPKAKPAPLMDSMGGYRSEGNTDDIVRDATDNAWWEAAEIAGRALFESRPDGAIDVDVRLRDAAADLYEALEVVVAIADRKTVEFDKARAALAKARGEPQ